MVDIERKCNLKLTREIQVTPGMTMEVNGQVVQMGEAQEIPVFSVICDCGNRLIQYQPGQPRQACEDEAINTISKNLIYCPKCGRRLNYDTLITIDV